MCTGNVLIIEKSVLEGKLRPMRVNNRGIQSHLGWGWNLEKVPPRKKLEAEIFLMKHEKELDSRL